jgi:DNA-binding transcriptional LysR family regulator
MAQSTDVMEDLNLLRALDALLEAGSVTGAADRLHLSAPAMSRTLGRIRRALGDPVLVRAGRGLVPTPLALGLRARVRAVVAEADDLLRPGAGTDPSTLRRTFTIRGNDDVAVFIGPQLLDRLQQEAPHVTVRFVQEGEEDVEDLRQGRIDLDLGPQHDLSPDITVDDLTEDRFVGVVATVHPLASGRVTPARFVAHPHVSMSRQGHTRGPVDAELEALGHTREVVATVPSISGALTLIEPGRLVGVLPSLAVAGAGRRHWTDLVAVPLPVPTPTVTISLAWHRRYDEDPAHRYLRGALRGSFLDALAASFPDAKARRRMGQATKR